MTTSDSAARCRMPCDEAVLVTRTVVPRQFSELAAISPQSGSSSGRSSISARSPVSVAAAHRSISRQEDLSIGLGRSATIDVGGLGHRFQTMEAQIVAATLHVGGGERYGERLAEDRKILEEDLFLKVLRPGGDERALAAQNGGGEVREGLAGASAGFDQQDAALGEGGRDCRSHLLLSRSGLECRN